MNVKKIIWSAMVSCCLLFPAAVQAEGWDTELQLYVLGTHIEGDAAIGRAQGVPVDVDMDKILETLNMAAMVHLETVHQSGWGMALDYSFMDLEDDISGPQGGVLDANVRQGVFEADLLYRTPMGKGTVDYLAGIRWWDNDFDVTVNSLALPGPASADREVDWVDVFVGARLITPVSEKWEFRLRGDIGGFGLEADFTGCLYGNMRWLITDNWALDVGYKALWVDYEEGTEGQRGYFAYDTVTHGPLVGVIYKF
ncbi:MAG: hypothetical protein ABFR63_06505 [Thermodesulfobacteriota bacterium]